MSQNRRLKRLQERQSKKLYEKIRLETLSKLSKLSPEERLILEQEYKQFIKDKDNGLQL
jgi:hypothetical protein